MIHPSDSNVTGLLLLIDRLQQAGQPLGRQTLHPCAEIKLPRVAENYDALIATILEEKLIQGSPESFSLTPDGAHLVQAVSQEHTLHAWFYNEYYRVVVHSQAHASFCERVYGKDLSQHGMADMAQVHLLLEALEVRPGMRLLDFGCGDGRISEYIADTTQALVAGVDIADQAIELGQMRTQAKRHRLAFYWAGAEFGQGIFPPGKFDRIITIDSITFARDQGLILKKLLDNLQPGGKMGLFYHCPGISTSSSWLSSSRNL